MKYILTLILGCAVGVLVAKVMFQPSAAAPTLEQRYNDAIALVHEITQVDIDLIEESRKPKMQMSNELRTQALNSENAMQFQLISEVLSKLCSNDFGVIADEPSHPISIAEAATFVDNYLNGLQNFCAPNDEVLKGWFIEKEHLDQLFARYPDGNGIQLCLGRKTTQGPDPLNLVWVVAKDPGTGAELEPMFEDYAIYEYLRPCPPKCPKKENIFR